ncbi:hypothetical protein GJ496_001412 [Pomphorhynchus laevis]|nr:hypothetical protein GJ496_001412 [Pomphorhynchus laevis]
MSDNIPPDRLKTKSCQPMEQNLTKLVCQLNHDCELYENLYKKACRKELRCRAELYTAHNHFKQQLFQMRKKDEPLILLRYLASRLEIQDKTISENKILINNLVDNLKKRREYDSSIDLRESGNLARSQNMLLTKRPELQITTQRNECNYFLIKKNTIEHTTNSSKLHSIAQKRDRYIGKPTRNRVSKQHMIYNHEQNLEILNQEKILTERIMELRAYAKVKPMPNLRQRQFSGSSVDDERLSISRNSDHDDQSLFDAMKDTNQALKAELARLTPLETEVKQLKEEVEARKKREQDLLDTIVKLKSTSETSQIQIDQKEKEIISLNQKVNTLLHEKCALHSLQQESKQIIGAIKDELVKLKQNNIELFKDNQNLKKAYDNLQQKHELQNKQLLSKIDDLTSKYDNEMTKLCSKCVTKKEHKTYVQTGVNTIITGRVDSAEAYLSKDYCQQEEHSPCLVHLNKQTTLNINNAKSLANCNRLLHDCEQQITKTKSAVAIQSKNNDLYSSKFPQSYLTDLSGDFSSLRETVQASEKRHRQLEKDYERTLLRFNLKEEELDNLRTV